MFIKIRDFFWPVLAARPESEREGINRQEADELVQIKNTDWSSEVDVALQEAHRISAEEEDRLKTVASKATNLLLFVALLVPLLTYLKAVVLNADVKSVPPWITLMVLALAVAYLVKASLWAFKILGVGNYHRVYSSDLVKVWGNKSDLKRGLVVEILSATRRNQEAVNSKATALKMTHAFLLRAILALSSLSVGSRTF